MNKRHFLTLAASAIGGFAFGRGPTTAASGPGHGDIQDAGVSFGWRHENGRLHARLSAPTKGWIAAGFNEKPQLKNTWFVIAAVSLNPIVVEERIALVPEHREVQHLGLKPILADIRGAMEKGSSTLAFSFPHKIPQRPALALVPGAKVQLMLAWSTSTDFQHHSAWRRHYDITL